MTKRVIRIYPEDTPWSLIKALSQIESAQKRLKSEGYDTFFVEIVSENRDRDYVALIGLKEERGMESPKVTPYMLECRSLVEATLDHKVDIKGE